MRSALLVLCAAACAALAYAQTDPEAAGFGSDDLEMQEDVFTPEPSRVFMPFYVPGWTNAYVPNISETCSGTIAGFTDTPMSDADCHAPFQFLLERGTRKVRYGCFKCAGAFQVTPAAAPYATCGGKPICSALPLAYYRCFLRNDPTSDIFSCLMDVDYQADK